MKRIGLILGLALLGSMFSGRTDAVMLCVEGDNCETCHIWTNTDPPRYVGYVTNC